MVLRLTNERDKGVIKNLLPDALKSTIEFLPLLDVGEALVVGDAILFPSRQPDNAAIQMAVEALRRQSR